MNIFKKGVLATTLAASALVASVSPAAAQDYRRDRDNTAAVAIGAGILGLAVGAIAASGNDDRYRDRRYYDRQYYSNDGWNGSSRSYDRSRRYHRRDRRGDDWHSGYSRNGSYSRNNDWRRGDRQRSDGQYYGRRGY